MLNVLEKRALTEAVDNMCRRNDYQGVDVLLESLEKILSYASGFEVKVIGVKKDNK